MKSSNHLYIIVLFLSIVSIVVIDATVQENEFESNHQPLYRSWMMMKMAEEPQTYQSSNDIWSLATSDGKCNDTKFGTVPDPNDCTGYYICSMEYAYRRHCPPLTLFDYQQKQCVYHTNAECFSNEQFICPRRFGLFRHRKCDRYWICVNGKATIKYCSYGRKFDVRFNQCRLSLWASCVEQQQTLNDTATTTTTTTATSESMSTTTTTTTAELSTIKPTELPSNENDKNFTMTLTPSLNSSENESTFNLTTPTTTTTVSMIMTSSTPLDPNKNQNQNDSSTMITSISNSTPITTNNTNSTTTTTAMTTTTTMIITTTTTTTKMTTVNNNANFEIL
nr:uncharacterized protein LOC124496859 [Dermatophagoides farinae]